MTFTVLLGGPGAGKGTQAAILSKAISAPHIATGDIFRAAVRDGSVLGLEAKGYMERGQLVPDAVTVRMLLERLSQPDAVHGVVLDGFPRTRAQAEALDRALAGRGSRVDRVLEIVVATDELVRRMSGRWICEASGHVYNVVSQPPTVAGRCDVDGSPLYQRADDREETIRARLDQQLGALAEVADYYREQGLLTTIDGQRPVDAVACDLLAAASTSDAA